LRAGVQHEGFKLFDRPPPSQSSLEANLMSLPSM
jgi:hypothetical protein